MNATAFVTIVSNNYLHFARTLMQSVARQHPEADRYCVIVDRDLSHAEALAEEFSPLPLDVLNLPDGDEFLYQYDVLELNTAVKPWALAHLLRRGYGKVVYLDPDIWVYRPLVDVIEMLDAGADLVLTPHLLAPVEDASKPGDLDVRRAGTYNLGFCALRQSENSLALLAWWQGKLRRHCIVAFEQGIFVDQSWMDLVPGLFANVGILRHPGYNVAYWNIAQRPPSGAEDDYQVLGQPLVFFHFSGLNPLAPQTVSKYQDRYTLDDIGAVAANIILDYCRRVSDNGITHYRGIAYAFGRYDDGTPIAAADRLRYRNDPVLRAQVGAHPFAQRALLGTAASDVFAPPAQPVDAPPMDAESAELFRIYAHFLGRRPDAGALVAYRGFTRSASRRLRTLLAVALSAEARAKPGWMARLLKWPPQISEAAPPPQASVSPRVEKIVWTQTRPAPYGGLHGPEPDSADKGLWVGPRLDLPACALTAGHIRIEGEVNLGLLARAGRGTAFHLDIHSPHEKVHTAPIAQDGAFTIEFTLPSDAFVGGSQWTLMASSHIVPKAAGLGEDSRALAWRVKRIEVDGRVLIDSARSPVSLPIDQLMEAGGINLVGYLAAELGVGEAARSLARACLTANIPFSAVDVSFQSQNLKRDTAILAHATNTRYPIDMLYVNADQTPIISAYLKSKGLESRYRIGYWHWEQPELPPEAIAAFGHVDEVWVPTTFVHDAVAPFSPVPVVKIPHALEFTPSSGLTRAQFGLPDDKLLVLTLYDFHSYQARKNPQAAIAAFRLAAAKRRDVLLVIKTINGQHHADKLQALRDSVADLDNIRFIDEFFTRQQTWDLEACCDILLSLHRAEGFGLGPAEMMYLGKAVVATGWSANMDFMTAENSFPVRYQLKPLAEPVGVYPAGQLWAEADIEHAADCLTRLFDDPALRQEIGRIAARDIRKQLSPQAVGAQVRRRLAILQYWNPRLQSSGESRQ